jgi:hypothetical protein
VADAVGVEVGVADAVEVGVGDGVGIAEHTVMLMSSM